MKTNKEFEELISSLSDRLSSLEKGKESLKNEDKTVEGKESLKNEDKTVECRQNIFHILEKEIMNLYGTQQWKYRFIQNCRSFHKKEVRYPTLNDMKKGIKNSTSEPYVLMILEIQRLKEVDTSQLIKEYINN